MKRVNIEQARKLKELGFNLPTSFGYELQREVWSETNCKCWTGSDIVYEWNSSFGKDRYGNKIDVFMSAPYISEVLEWIREEKSILSAIEYEFDGNNNLLIEWIGVYGNLDFQTTTNHYKTYEEAESALLDELIRILDEK